MNLQYRRQFHIMNLTEYDRSQAQARLHPEYETLAAVRKLPPEADDWLALMKDVLCLPLSMLPSVQRVVRNAAWTHANDPVGSVRNCAVRHAIRAERAGSKV
jgi:hypothetical protein